MWFGDLVTMRWWDDLWLNESFAEYLAHRVTAGDHATCRRGRTSRPPARRGGTPPTGAASTHPVAGNGARDAASALDDFDGISYAKGASVLRQLAAYLGDDDVPRRSARPLRGHAYGNATFADLLDAWAGRPGGRPGPDGGRPAPLGRRVAAHRRVSTSSTVRPRRPRPTAARPVRPCAAGRRCSGRAADRPHAFTVAVLPGGATHGGRRRRRPATAHRPGDAGRRRAAERGRRVLGHRAPGPRHLVAAAGGRSPRTRDGRARVVVWNALRTALDDGLVSPDARRRDRRRGAAARARRRRRPGPALDHRRGAAVRRARTRP